jgi:hypothetical protein
VPWYQYSATPTGLKPLVAVRLVHGNRQVQLVATVDSGANSSLLDIGYADLLGLDRTQAREEIAILANGEQTSVFKYPEGILELQFENRRFPFRGTFTEFGPDSDFENLMGRKDFFANFIIQFWDARNLMNIDLSPDYAHGDASSRITP